MHEYGNIYDRVKDMWEAKRRDSLAQQPFVKYMAGDVLFWKPH